MKILLLFLLICLFTHPVWAQHNTSMQLANDHLNIQWEKTGKGWEIVNLSILSGQQWKKLENLS